MSAPLTCWVMSDGRRGIENQALGLAEAMAETRSLDISIHHLTRTGFGAKLPPFLQTLFGPKNTLPNTLPDIAIGCGRQAIAQLIDLKSKGVFTVYVQDPRIAAENFDVIIAPEHDNISGENVLKTIGSPNRITPEKLAEDQDMIAPKTSKVAAFLIGGKSKTHDYSDNDIHRHIELILELLEDGWEVYLTASRRTLIKALEFFAHIHKDHDSFEYYAGRGPNPYFAYLHHATAIFVTEDSTNMLTEACTTGKPVFRLPMSGTPGKFQKLYDRLETRCHVTPILNSEFQLAPYPPLCEAERAAEFSWKIFDKKSQV